MNASQVQFAHCLAAHTRAPPPPPPTPPHTQLGEANKYLKGLCVVDDIAFFGIAVAGERASRADSALSCELAAYDLRQGLLLWRRKLPTQGLLNVGACGGGQECRLVAAPGQGSAAGCLLRAHHSALPHPRCIAPSGTVPRPRPTSKRRPLMLLSLYHTACPPLRCSGCAALDGGEHRLCRLHASAGQLQG